MDDKSYPYSPGSQKVDTSIEAAELIKAGADTIRRKVFDVIINKGSFGATADEVADLLALSSFTVRPRVTELYKQNKIERKDKRKNASQRLAYVYVVSKDHVNNQYTQKGT
jgi:transcription initiation factor IIE alpha subunit|tara:strand:+ start:469 stop:801 length:333 start_codon:yes stop_codon:yes gene_type:complete